MWESTFDIPEHVISVRGTAFTSENFKQYCTESNIHYVLTTTGMHSNGQVEKLNSTIINVLTKLCIDKPENDGTNCPKYKWH